MSNLVRCEVLKPITIRETLELVLPAGEEEPPVYHFLHPQKAEMLEAMGVVRVAPVVEEPVVVAVKTAVAEKTAVEPASSGDKKK